MLSRSLKQAIPRSRLPLPQLAGRQLRSETTSANIPANVAEATKKDSHELVVSEPAEVIAADIVSGAPGLQDASASRIRGDKLTAPCCASGVATSRRKDIQAHKKYHAVR